MNFEFFLVRKIAFHTRNTFSSFIIRIALAAVVLSVSTMIIATSLVNGFQTEIRNKVFGFWAHLNIVPFSLTKSMGQDAVYKYQDFYTDNKLIPEARHIQATAMKGGLLKTKEDFEGIVMKGVGEDFDWSFFKAYLKKGSIISADSTKSQRDILISTTTANRLKIGVGDKVVVNFMDKSIRTRPFKVCGIYETGLDEFDKQYAIVDIRLIQDLNGWGRDSVGGFEVFLKEQNLFKDRSKAYFLTLFGGLLDKAEFEKMKEDPIDRIGKDIYFRLPNNELDVQTIKYLNPGIFDWLELQTMNELIILTLMILVAAINMMTALLILILERTNMIGIMKALGMSDESLRKMFLYYAALIVGGGLVLGNVVGIGLCLIQKYLHVVKLPQESYYISEAPIALNLQWIVGLNVLTLAICLLLLLLPARFVSKISPVKAIRFS